MFRVFQGYRLLSKSLWRWKRKSEALNYSLCGHMQSVVQVQTQGIFHLHLIVWGTYSITSKEYATQTQRELYFQNIGACWNQCRWMRKWDMNTTESTSAKPAPAASTESWYVCNQNQVRNLLVRNITRRTTIMKQISQELVEGILLV
jgi:hypothetical protein